MTRGILAAGIALLLADKLNADQRKAAGWTMLLIGAVSTIPLGIQVWAMLEKDSTVAAGR
jgi:hypothetical protein